MKGGGGKQSGEGKQAEDRVPGRNVGDGGKKKVEGGDALAECRGGV